MTLAFDCRNRDRWMRYREEASWQSRSRRAAGTPGIRALVRHRPGWELVQKPRNFLHFSATIPALAGLISRREEFLKFLTTRR
jgi:hypothetical protein